MASERTRVKRIGRHGDVVIPAHLRRRLGLTEGSAVVAEERDGGVLIRPAEQPPDGDAWWARLLDETRAADAARRADPEAWREEQEEERRTAKFFEQLNADYAALRADPEAWRQMQEEDKLWEATLMDGLDPDEVWEFDDDRAK